MKKILTLLFSTAICMLLVLSSNTYVMTNSGTPPPGKTGYSGPAETCRGCHSGAAPNPSGGSLEVVLGASQNSYALGETYDMSVTVNDPAKIRFGFQMEARDANNNSLAGFAATGANVGISVDGGVEYVNHSSVPGTNNGEFTFQWTAPANDVGTITFYASGLAGNGNFATSGDNVYTTEFSVSPAITSVEEVIANPKNIHIYPNPVQDQLNLFYVLPNSQQLNIAVYDMAGKMVQQLWNGQQNAGHQEANFRLAEGQYHTGVYMLVIEGETFTTSKQLLVK